MQAVILAGGLGTRLLPLTQEQPKSLVMVHGRPFLAWQLEQIARCGFSEVVLCIGHLGSKIREFVGDGRKFGLAVTCSEDGATALGTGGALRAAEPLLHRVFLLTYGDSYLPFDYAGPIRDLEQHPEALGAMAVYRNCGAWDASNVRVDADRVVRYQKGVPDPTLDHIDYGALALRREALERVARLPSSLEELQQDLAQSGVLRAYRAADRFYEIGSISGIRDLERHLAARGK